jgi:uncharacterized membrane protein YgcG
MRTIFSLALLAVLSAFTSAPAAAQGRDISPRIDQLNSKEELRAARERDAKLKKKKKDGGGSGGGGNSGGGAPGGGSSY